MKKSFLGVFVLVFFTTVVHTQEQLPKVLLHAAQCLEGKKFLPSSNAAELSFGYLVDEKSYPGDKVIYVINPARSNPWSGLVFAVFLTEHDGRQEFNIQNNGSFVLSKDHFDRVPFVNPPLGGTWTQEHMASAIAEIEKRPSFRIKTAQLSSASTSVTCTAYTDPQRKAGLK